jgi:glycosyltransferase involved in cell wall biosynthesis
MSKYALLSYIPRGRFSGNEPGPFSKAPIILRILDELGYEVDVINWTDFYTTDRRYDLFVGHGGANWEHLCKTVVKPNAPKIFFGAGYYWKEFNRLEKERFVRFKERTGVDLAPDRLITFPEEYAVNDADSLVILGADMHKSYAEFPQVYSVNNFIPDDDHFDATKKDFKAGSKHFLFFAGAGNIHKGLDLLVEAFSSLDLHLWCVTYLEKRFIDAYAKLLAASPNIHLRGFVKFRSREYYEFMNKCNFVINASCSEGQSGAVPGCMIQGLIPVITKAVSVDVGNFGVVFKNDSIEEIARTVKEVSEQPIEWYIEHSKLAYQTSRKDYSYVSFYHKVKKAIVDTIDIKQRTS